MTYYTIFKSATVGNLLLLANADYLTGLYFVRSDHEPRIQPDWKPDGPLLQHACRELSEYFAGKRTDFTVPLAASGTPFQKEIWRQIAKIPFGQTITYSELARRAGSPRAIRAAGTATGKNPLGIIVPCHRVLAMHGALGGFAGGLKNKRALLAVENKGKPGDLF